MSRLARQPAVAGLFYPAEASELEATVDDLLDVASGGAAAASAAPKAVIAPHAGYVYSGVTAAIAISSLRSEDDRIERVVLLGPSHFVALRGLAASSASYFETPLGPVAVDLELRDRLLALDQVETNDLAHGREHSLEVLLPFLQRALGGLTVVPLTVGDTTPEEVAEVLELAWGDEATRIVVSSDLSHYHDYTTAREIDARTRLAIEALDAYALAPEDACGCYAVNGLLEIARRRGLEPTTLDLRNSGDTAGGRDRVVGYGAWSFT